MPTKEELQARMEKARAVRMANIAAAKDKPKSTIPWQPARKLDIPADLKTPGRRYRFVNSKSEGNELKKRQEGWEFDTEILAKMQERGLLPARRALNDGTPLDTHYTIREMVLMWMPEEMAEARNEYYRDRGTRAQRGFKETFASQNPDVAVYGDNKEEREFRKI